MGWLIGLGVLVALVGAFVLWVRGAQAKPEDLAKAAAALASFLERHRGAVEATRRPVVAFELEAMAADELLASKVGGAAWWPEGCAHPTSAKGEALVLLAQVDLAALPPSGLDLPKQGLLQFFFVPDWRFGEDRPDDQSPESLALARGHQVVYHADASGPAAPLPAATKRQLPLEVAGPLRMVFSVGSETMSREDWRFDKLFPGGFDAALEQHCEPEGANPELAAEGMWECSDSDRHKLGGYPSFTQEDPRNRPELELLFQLVSDDGVMWGDAGIGNFFITDADLAARDFSRVFYRCDCC
jgi:uncharacterized protein YwqG